MNVVIKVSISGRGDLVTPPWPGGIGTNWINLPNCAPRATKVWRPLGRIRIEAPGGRNRGTGWHVWIG